MSRWLTTLTIAAIVTGLVGAQGANKGGLLPSRQAEFFQQNRALVQQLVTTSLELSNTDDPVARLSACNRLADDLAKEVRQAVQNGDAERTADLGGHLGSVLVQSVAPTFRDARLHISRGSDEERHLFTAQTKVVSLTESLERLTQSYSGTPLGNDLSEVMRQVRTSRTHVDEAVKGE